MRLSSVICVYVSKSNFGEDTRISSDFKEIVETQKIHLLPFYAKTTHKETELGFSDVLSRLFSKNYL